MTALAEWQAKVAAFRVERGETEDQHWQSTVEWYDYNSRYNVEIAAVLPRLTRVVTTGSRVLEIGPGPGPYTVRLAPVAAEVVAIEPSAGMRGVLERNLARAGITNTRIIPRRVEDALDEIEGPFDLALAADSLYCLDPIDAVVRKLAAEARHTAVLTNTGMERDWSLVLYREFKGRERAMAPQLELFYRVLLEMGICADVEVIPVSSSFVFPSVEEMTAWYGRLFHIEEARYAELQAALLPHAERRGDQVGVYRRREIVLIWIDAGRSLAR